MPDQTITVQLSRKAYDGIFKLLDTHKKGLQMANMNEAWKKNLLDDISTVVNIIKTHKKGE